MLALLDAWFIAPFDYGFMRRAVVGGLALSLAAPPLGVFLVLRGMSLIGDAMAHAILPGVALGFLLAGFSLPVMSVGGVLFGVMVALLAPLIRCVLHNQDSPRCPGGSRGSLGRLPGPPVLWRAGLKAPSSALRRYRAGSGSPQPARPPTARALAPQAP